MPKDRSALLGAGMLLTIPILIGAAYTATLDPGETYEILDNAAAVIFRAEGTTRNVILDRNAGPDPTLFVDGANDRVGLGTSTPSQQLELTGNMQLPHTTPTTGNIMKGGQLFMHNVGTNNAFLGRNAGNLTMGGLGNNGIGLNVLSLNAGGARNSAFGNDVLQLNTSGNDNSAFGEHALSTNQTGSRNSAFGQDALRNNTGGDNTAVGEDALMTNGTGDRNTAIGEDALLNNSTGSRNIALGNDAGLNQNTGNDNIYIGNVGVAGESGQIRVGVAGTHTNAFIPGVVNMPGVFPNLVVGASVLVTAGGNLGIGVSSRRFKQAVRDMGDDSKVVMDLRPTSFRYREEVAGSGDREHYGLIAEEVAEVAPQLVHFDEQGEPLSVHYEFLTPMLLNELQRQEHVLDSQSLLIQEQQAQIRRFAARIEKLESTLGAASARAR